MSGPVSINLFNSAHLCYKMRITIIRLLQLLYLTSINSERIIYPSYCYDHQSTILVTFSANFTYENFRQYLIDFVDIIDCEDSSFYRYTFGLYPIQTRRDCLKNEPKRSCIRQILDNETFARECYNAAKNSSNGGDILQIDDKRGRTGYMRGIATQLVISLNTFSSFLFVNNIYFRRK